MGVFHTCWTTLVLYMSNKFVVHGHRSSIGIAWLRNFKFQIWCVYGIKLCILAWWSQRTNIKASKIYHTTKAKRWSHSTRNVKQNTSMSSLGTASWTWQNNVCDVRKKRCVAVFSRHLVHMLKAKRPVCLAQRHFRARKSWTCLQIRLKVSIVPQREGKSHFRNVYHKAYMPH